MAYTMRHTKLVGQLACGTSKPFPINTKSGLVLSGYRKTLGNHSSGGRMAGLKRKFKRGYAVSKLSLERGLRILAKT